MAKIFYSMAGEGRGHATRVRTVVEMLRGEHEVTLFAPATAYQLLAAVYTGTNVVVRNIPGLLFHYRSARLSYLHTGIQAAQYLRNLPQLIRRLCAELHSARPDLVITDFEPALPRAARKCSVPFVSLDHQHFLVASDLSALPRPLHRKARAMGAVVNAYYHGQAETIVSSFYFPPLRRGYEDVVQIGGLFRPRVARAVPTPGEHLLVYVHRTAEGRTLEALHGCGGEVRVYGLGARAAEGNLRFMPVDEDCFIRDLASCQALVCCGGNQLLGEALFLGKPVLALPEPNHFEQQINAHFLRAGGGGDWLPAERLDAAALRRFLAQRDEFQRPDRSRLCGNQAALEAIGRHLPSQRKRDVGPIPWNLAKQGPGWMAAPQRARVR